jgi:endonuclease III
VTDRLYQVVKTPLDILNLWEEELGEYIRFVGLWKAKKKNIYKTAQMLANSEQLMTTNKEPRTHFLGSQEAVDRHPERNTESYRLSNPKEASSSWWKSGSRESTAKVDSLSTKDWNSWDPSIVPTSLNQNDDSIRTHHQWSHRSTQEFRESSQQMQSHCWYSIPDTLKWIMELPWVWVKTAKVVLAVLYGQEWIAVDTHVDRVSKRLGRIRWNVSADTTSKRLEKKIPNEYKWKAHRSIIYFGRYHCTAKKPNCESCPFKDWCPEGGRRIKQLMANGNK